MAKAKALFRVSSDDLARGLFIATWTSAGVVKLDFGKLFEDLGDFTQFDEVQRGIIINGVSQKLRDCVAKSDLSEGEKFEIMASVAGNLEAGMWNQKREVGGAQDWNVFCEAFAHIRGQELAAAREVLVGVRDSNMAKKPDLKRADVEKAIIHSVCDKNPAVREWMDKIKTSRINVIEDLDLDDLIDDGEEATE